jgi:glutathione-regulated potassium-efflux system ancillary protein KefC
MELGVEVFERETFLSAISLGAKVLAKLGYETDRALHLAKAFEEHDNKLLHDSFAVRNDEDAYVGLVRQSMGLLSDAMAADKLPDKPADAAPKADGPVPGQ